MLEMFNEMKPQPPSFVRSFIENKAAKEKALEEFRREFSELQAIDNESIE